MTDENIPTDNSGREIEDACDRIKPRMTRGSFYPTATCVKLRSMARSGRRS